MFRYLLLVILTWQSTEQLMFGFERSVNIITLFCSTEQGQRINLETNTTVKFYLNRTLTGPSTTSRDELGQIVHLLISGTTATFPITPNLEGYFACGSTGPSDSLVISQPKALIALPSSDGFPVNGETVYAVESSASRATIPCPFEPGNLRTCYYGEWTKNGTEIAKISKPSLSCGSGGDFMSNNPTKYEVNRGTFSLTISSVNAEDDTGQYQCQLRVLNPTTSTGQTNDFRSFPVTLIVDGQPNITEAPRDVVIGLDTMRGRLMETATFNCTALGRPIPEIEWFYIPINPDGTPGMPELLTSNIMSNDGAEDPTRRFQRTSTLTMAVTENDGGIIRCKADRSYKDAHLTVLSKPSINIIETLRGEIIYDIELKVHIYHPVTLNFTYQDVNNGAYFSRDSQPDETYNDTKEITYRENKEDVPAECRRCRVAVSLTAMSRNEVTQGLSVTSSDVIDVQARTPEQTIVQLRTTIAISCAILVSVIGVGGIAITVVACCCLVRRLKSKHTHDIETLKTKHEHEQEHLKTKQKHKNEIAYNKVESLEENVIDLGDKTDETYRMNMIERIKKKLEELKELMKEESTEDDYSDDIPQVDLKQVDECLKELILNIKTQRGNKRV